MDTIEALVPSPARRGRSSAARAPGDNTESARQAGPSSGPSGRRWVPPSALRHRHAPDSDASYDVIFRKVRGILNKLTPEKFQKLSDDLLRLELDSDKVLKGVILLIFEKALDEPKYSSMYAQLCKRLSEEAPNFEPADQPCSFKLLLLNKCRTEFENRAQACAAFDSAALPAEEEEKRHVAKCKMLGNIKFIGELGKLEILAEATLHRCIQQLLARRPGAEMHEDLECLAQLVRTCGRVLDSPRGRGLMDQYFARVEQLSHSPDLAPRIRFMLRDVTELRRGGWVPRAAVSAEGPVPIQQLGGDAEPVRRDPLFRTPMRARPLDDVLAGLSLQGSSPLLGDKLFGAGLPARDAFRPAHYNYRHSNQHYSKPDKQNNKHSREFPETRRGARVLPAGALGDVQMRPAANSLLYSAHRLQRASPPALNVLTTSFAPAAPLLKEPAITIKPAPDKKDKIKKDKGVNVEEAVRAALDAVQALAEAGAPDADADLDPPPPTLPDKAARRVTSAVLELGAAAEGDRAGATAAAAVRYARALRRGGLGEALRGAALPGGGGPARNAAALLAAGVAARALTLADAAALCDGGAHYPLLLQVLEQLVQQAGLERTMRLYADSKINVCAHVSAALGGAEGAGGAGGAGAAGAALAELEARGLAALEPVLAVHAALASQLQQEPQPHKLYRWIKANVEPHVRQTPAFVSQLVALLAGHVTAAAGAARAPDKAALDKEKTLVEAYAPLLTALLEGRAELQLAAVYAVQLHAHAHRYPKGMLLRWFMYLYNLEVCEEDAFLRWREDVTDAYPGKGEALFQVNAWLTWLQQQDSEDDDADD